MRLSGDERGAVWRAQLTRGEREDIVIDREGTEQLIAFVTRASTSAECRVIVLEGEAGCFCRGMDLEGVRGADVDIALQRYGDLLAALRQSSKAIIAAVDGAVMAGGVGLAAAADIVIATEQSEVGLAEVMLGLVPGMVLATLMERMPLGQARRLAMRVASIDAREALRIGLFDEVVADDGLERGLRTTIKSLLRADPDALAALKRLTRKLAGASFTDALNAGREATAERLAVERTRAAIESFVAGEPLPWFDRYRP